jgi:hypothetical protein
MLCILQMALDAVGMVRAVVVHNMGVVRSTRTERQAALPLPEPLRQLRLKAFYAAVKVNLALRRNKYRYVFVLGHMRSGSTLLTHILLNHPDFSGSIESHITYTGHDDLKKLIYAVCKNYVTLNIGSCYLVDQINHDSNLSIDILSTDAVDKCIIILRSPMQALQSMLSILGVEEKDAVQYYLSRLDTLSEYGAVLGGRALFVDYDDLVFQTEQTLRALSRFFGVGQPFTSDYKVYRETGRTGDKSDNIWTGRVITTQRHEDIRISPEAMSLSYSAFVSCKDRLLSSGVCAVI